MVNFASKAQLIPSMSLDVGPLAKIDAVAKASEEMEADLSDLTGLEQTVKTIPPSFNASVAGQLAQVSMAMKMTGTEFNLFDPIRIKEQLDIMAGELNRRASSIQMMSGMNLGAIVKLGAAARMVARIKAEIGDPEDPGFPDAVAAKAKTAAYVQAHKPQIGLGTLPQVHLIANLPKVLEAAAEAEVDLGQ